MRRKIGMAGGGTAALFVALAALQGCPQTPPNQGIRSFEGPQKAASVCLQVNDPQGYPLLAPPLPVPIDECVSVPQGVNGALLPNHLYVLVTQTVRGEIGVVDLTSGDVVDEDRSTPETNFIPVGQNPTDVTVAPDSKFSYVSSALPTAPGIYALDNTRILGTSVNWETVGSSGAVSYAAPLQLTNLTACSLPDIPLALGTVPVAATGGGDGGTTASYYVAAMLQGALGPARVVLVDPVRSGLIGGTPGALPKCVIAGSVDLSSQLPATWVPGTSWPDGIIYADAGSLAAAEPLPGPACIATPTTLPEAGGGATPPAAPAPVEASVLPDAGHATLTDGEVDDEGGAPAGSSDAADAGASIEADAEAAAAAQTAAAPQVFPLTVQPASTSSPRFMVMRSDLPILYVADDGVPLIHVIDLSTPSSPQELQPLLATSLAEPTRQVHVGALAISPPTRDYKIYLYAIDSHDGSLMVYDVSSPAATTHMPMTRPHAELNPLQPPDRISFSSPVATLAFIQHDWPVPAVAVSGIVGNGDNVHTFSGLLCNPSPNAHPSANSFLDLGAWYRADQVAQIEPQATIQTMPSRLRGVFGLATLANGSIVTIDVDDWDAPCRRPDPMTNTQVVSNGPNGYQTSALDLPEPAPSPPTTDLNAYHVPVAYNSAIPESPAVTLEPFYPVSAPNRARSSALLRNDPTTGNHAPNLLATPILVDVNGNPVPSSTTNGLSPIMLPTTLPPGYIDPTLAENPVEPNPANQNFSPVVGSLGEASSLPVPDVRFSFEDPTVMQNQDWSVTYEGVLPATVGVEADIASTAPAGSPGAYASLTFTISAQNLCSMGIEDYSIGQLRAAQVEAALASQNPPLPAIQTNVAGVGNVALGQWTADYVQIIDDVAPYGDPYWSVNPPGTGSLPTEDGGQAEDNCWAGTPFDEPSDNYANLRYQACYNTFGPSDEADSFYARDLPIVAAFSDHLVVGRFGWIGPTEQTNNRIVVPYDPVNSPLPLKLATCCFHRQAAFSVRTGGEWVAVGQSGLGLLHHVVTDPSSGACRLSCDPNDVLMNSRSFDIPYGNPSGSTGGCTPPGFPFPAGQVAPPIDRNSVLAMRNPMFSYVTWSGCSNTSLSATSTTTGQHTFTSRDLSWHFSTRGGFAPLTMSLNGGTGGAVNPQSMLFIDPLGQIAIVDGAAEGLVVFDLNSLSPSHSPFY